MLERDCVDHCAVCDDFDIRVPCHKNEGHLYKMMKVGLDADVGTSPSDMKKVNEEARKLQIQNCIQSLVHACQCRDANCCLPKCQKMKRVVTHTKICKRKTQGDCPICKQLLALCCYHADNCSETKCWVPFCSSSIKLKLQSVQIRMQQAQLLRQGKAAMPQPHTLSHDERKALQQQHQKAMQQLIAALRLPSGLRQAQEILQILNSNPPLMAAFIRQRQVPYTYRSTLHNSTKQGYRDRMS